MCVMSVDPPNCKDIDDALHIRDLGDGTLEAGVHIADVSEFVRPGTAVDKVSGDGQCSAVGDVGVEMR